MQKKNTIFFLQLFIPLGSIFIFAVLAFFVCADSIHTNQKWRVEEWRKNVKKRSMFCDIISPFIYFNVLVRFISTLESRNKEKKCFFFHFIIFNVVATRTIQESILGRLEIRVYWCVGFHGEEIVFGLFFSVLSKETIAEVQNSQSRHRLIFVC